MKSRLVVQKLRTHNRRLRAALNEIVDLALSRNESISLYWRVRHHKYTYMEAARAALKNCSMPEYRAHLERASVRLRRHVERVAKKARAHRQRLARASRART